MLTLPAGMCQGADKKGVSTSPQDVVLELGDVQLMGPVYTDGREADCAVTVVSVPAPWLPEVLPKYIS